MDIKTFFVTQDREKSTDSVQGAATQESIDSAVADLGGVRGVQMGPPLAASNVFLRT